MTARAALEHNMRAMFGTFEKKNSRKNKKTMKKRETYLGLNRQLD
jgi:hypothetical protein